MFSPDTSFFIAMSVLATGAVLSVVARKLTLVAGLGAFVVGMGVYLGDNYTGLLLLAAFFLLATLATAHGKQLKAKLTVQSIHPERRTLGQVLANGGVAALLGLLAFSFSVYKELYALLLAAALASATADSLASELGMVYGRNAFNILTGKKEERGLDGVISLEGTLLGMAGSLVIALIYAAGHGIDLSLGIIIVAGTLGNLADSVLGASLERKHYLNNDLVNALNTLVAALVAFLMYLLLY